MFSNPRVNVIESDLGFSVQVLGRVGRKYTEGDRFVRIDSEVLAIKGISIAKNSIRFWESPSGREPVTEAEKLRIIENIRDALALQNATLEVL